MASPHPPEPLFEEYLFGRIPEEECARFEEHLLICARCWDELEKTDEYIHLMRAAAAEFDSLGASGPRATPWWRSPIAAMAGALAIMAALAVAIPYHTGAPGARVPVRLVSYRGGAEDTMAHARAGAGLDITVDCADLGATRGLRLEIVDAAGRPVWSGPSAAQPGSTLITARVERRFARGVYWVRLYSRQGELLREFGLRAQ